MPARYWTLVLLNWTKVHGFGTLAMPTAYRETMTVAGCFTRRR